MSGISHVFYTPLALFLAALVAMTTPAEATSPAPGTATVSGQLSYRERIALPPGSTATVVLKDISRADAPSKTLAKATFPAQQVPIPFELGVATDLMQASHRYSVSAKLHAPDGALLWITDTIIPVDPGQSLTEAGTISLVRVAARARTLVPGALIGAPWRIEDIAKRGVIDFAQTTITFSAKGRINGSGGCNNYNGSYTLEGDTLSFGPVAATRKACVPALADQENAFFNFLNTPLRARITETGALVLTNPEGQSLTARR